MVQPAAGRCGATKEVRTKRTAGTQESALEDQGLKLRAKLLQFLIGGI